MNQPIILYIFVAAALAIIALSLIRLLRLRKCRKIPGRIVDAVIETSTNADGDTSSGRFPVYEYEWQGQTQRYRSNSSSNKPVGTAVELYIDADGVIYEKRSAVLFLVVGLVFLAIALMQFFL